MTSLSSYKRLGAHRFHVTDRGDIDRARFDLLLEHLDQLGEGAHAIVDTGATTFVPLSTYLLRFEVPRLLKEMGHQLVVHTVIAGGKPQNDTAQGLLAILRNYDEDADIVVWLNPRFGVIEHQGKRFHEWKLYEENGERIRAVVELPGLDELVVMDLEAMFKRNQILDEALSSADWLIMERQRLRMFQRELYRAIDVAGIV